MMTTTTLTKSLTVKPCFLGPNLLEAIKEQLVAEHEGSFSEQYGHLVEVGAVLRYELVIVPFNSSVLATVDFEARHEKLEVGYVRRGVLRKIFPDGVLVEWNSFVVLLVDCRVCAELVHFDGCCTFGEGEEITFQVTSMQFVNDAFSIVAKHVHVELEKEEEEEVSVVGVGGVGDDDLPYSWMA